MKDERSRSRQKEPSDHDADLIPVKESGEKRRLSKKQFQGALCQVDGDYKVAHQRKPMFQGNRPELILLLCSVTGWGQCADSTVSGKTWWEMMQRDSSYACHTAVLTAARDLGSACSWPPGSTPCSIFDVCS